MAKDKEGKNKSFVLRVDSETMEAIERWAADEFRSVNGQIQYLLDQALRKSGRLPGGRKKPDSRAGKRAGPGAAPGDF
ncbi:MAG: Arc family DNA-binding protein [Odoribacteraceae bacterium]|jgi:hypothetical protein|nr:Arc family DNA-binding protein [Odoribacteraceae bacterium]